MHLSSRRKMLNKYIFHIVSSIILKAAVSQSIMRESITLIDFTSCDNVDDWMEVSDTVRTVGMSKAALTLQKTQVFQRAIFFTFLKPQPNGAGFAGVHKSIHWDLTEYQNIVIACRSNGHNENYKVVIQHNEETAAGDVSYEYFFTVPLSAEGISTIACPLSDFKAYRRGREIPDAPPLNTANITMFGFQVYGGVYSEIKQSGVSALEIDMTSDLVHAYLPCENDMVALKTSGRTLFDFTRTSTIENWTEYSDTVKATGMSKAAMVIQKTPLVQRAIFFTLFNPRPNGRGFAAMRCNTGFNLSDYQCITIKCRGQGINFKYKMLLRHNGQDMSTIVFGQIFTAPENEFKIVKLPLVGFKPYYRGRELSLDENPLDKSAIDIGLKLDMSPYLHGNQAGVAALEIDWIRVMK